MTLSTAYACLKSSARSALLGAAALGMLAASAPAALAQAKAPAQSDVFLGHFKDKKKPVLVYVFSDAKTPAMKEIDTVAIFPTPNYKPSGKTFKASEACSFTFDFDRAAVNKVFPIKLQSKPIYGPNSTQGTIDPFTLPAFFARESVKELIKNKHVKGEAEAAPYFNCAGWLWARLLDQKPDFWNEYLKKKIEEVKKK